MITHVNAFDACSCCRLLWGKKIEIFLIYCTATVCFKVRSHYCFFHVRLRQTVEFLQGDRKFPISVLTQPTAENADRCIQCESAFSHMCQMQHVKISFKDSFGQEHFSLQSALDSCQCDQTCQNFVTFRMMLPNFGHFEMDSLAFGKILNLLS